MMDRLATHDERETAVANAGYRLAYTVVSFGVLLSVAYRGLVENQASWDLLGWVMLGGLAATVYQAQARTLNRRWAVAGVAIAVLAALVAIALVTLTR